MSLEKLRDEIDQLDQELLKTLAKRKEIVQRISLVKQQTNLPIRDLKREKEMLKKRFAHNLDSQFVENLFKLIIDQSVKEQGE